MFDINSYAEVEKIKDAYDNFWEESEYNAVSMHSIHAYPAKFPPFIAGKAIDYAIKEGVKVRRIGDVFCGCGTTALEAKLRGLDFWGCDINPVAAMISSAKVADYSAKKLQAYYSQVMQYYQESSIRQGTYATANERLRYWYSERQYDDLFKLFDAINSIIPSADNVALEGFYCVFSAILKKASRWLQKSIKPQVDPHKQEVNVKTLFENQFKSFIKAVKEINQKNITQCKCEIWLGDFLTCKKRKKVDLILTSPPYVTSYEYADLHQLSSLWLGYTNDYKELRKGTIGSGYNYNNCSITKLKLNTTASSIVAELQSKCITNSKILPIARYYSEMQAATKKCYEMLNQGGMAVFVIGDTELGGVKLLNSVHLVETMISSGFTSIKIGKRTVSKGICVPYRNAEGRFTQDKESSHQIYHEEFIISGRKK